MSNGVYDGAYNPVFNVNSVHTSVYTGLSNGVYGVHNRVFNSNGVYISECNGVCLR